MSHNTYPTQISPEHQLQSGLPDGTPEQHLTHPEVAAYDPVQEAEGILHNTEPAGEQTRFVGRAAVSGAEMPGAEQPERQDSSTTASLPSVETSQPDGPDTGGTEDHFAEPVDRHVSISNGVGHLQIREGDLVRAVTDPFGNALELTTAHEAHTAHGYMYVDGKLVARRDPNGQKVVLDESGNWLPAPGFRARRALERDGGIAPHDGAIEEDESEPERVPVEPVRPTIEAQERDTLGMTEKAERLKAAGVYAKPEAVAMELFHKEYSQLRPNEQLQVGMVTEMLRRQRPSFSDRIRSFFGRR